jgi:hypothetical protein
MLLKACGVECNSADKYMATTVPLEAVKAENLDDASGGVRGGLHYGMAKMHGNNYCT